MRKLRASDYGAIVVFGLVVSGGISAGDSPIEEPWVAAMVGYAVGVFAGRFLEYIHRNGGE